MCANFAVVALVSLLITILFGRWEISLTITGILFTGWSIANYYVIEFHGSPLFFSEFANFGAAMDVASGYSFTIGKAVIGILLIFLVEMMGVGLLLFMRKRGDKKAASRCRIGSACFLLVDIAAIYIAFFSPMKIKPLNTMMWTWFEGTRDYGYVSCIVEDIYKSRNHYVKPQGYAGPESVVISKKTESQTQEVCPDIIVILNETFCDLSVFTDVDPDVDYLKDYYQIEHAIHGYAIIPGVGGGTNNSEFELLTSNSMNLLALSAPFNYVSMDKTGNNIVKNLEALGYTTYGMHCGGKANYSRNKAYPAIGFDNISLGRDAFQYYDTYGNRAWLDSDNYRDLIDLYEQAGDEPRFMYLLTYQNHGGYEQNEPEFDLVHTRGNFGNLTDDIDEYLSSVYMSAKAFADLTEYYSKVERPVIICMVGDHAPSFISELPAKDGLSAEMTEIAQRTVPYVIWANYDVDFSGYAEYTSMVDLIPMVMHTAGLPLTPYYQYVLDMHEVLPVRTSSGLYMDREGTVGTYEADSPYYDLITQYYYMEYNALKAGRDYQKEWFELG